MEFPKTSTMDTETPMDRVTSAYREIRPILVAISLMPLFFDEFVTVMDDCTDTGDES